MKYTTNAEHPEQEVPEQGDFFYDTDGDLCLMVDEGRYVALTVSGGGDAECSGDTYAPELCTYEEFFVKRVLPKGTKVTLTSGV